MSDQTVAEYLRDVSLGLLDDLAEDEKQYEETYWTNAQAFVNSNKTRKLSTLTSKQRSWVITIRDDLIREARA